MLVRILAIRNRTSPKVREETTKAMSAFKDNEESPKGVDHETEICLAFAEFYDRTDDI